MSPPVVGMPNTNPVTIRRQISWPSQFEERTDNRIKTVMDRIDLTTGKKSRSFLQQDGTIKFIERPCDLCEKTGKKDQWHFSFECPTREKMTTIIAETADSDSESDSEFGELPGVGKSQFTKEPTSYTFTASTSTLAGKV